MGCQTSTEIKRFPEPPTDPNSANNINSNQAKTQNSPVSFIDQTVDSTLNVNQQEQAATKIQAVYRGFRTRVKLKEQADQFDTDEKSNAPPPLSESNESQQAPESSSFDKLTSSANALLSNSQVSNQLNELSSKAIEQVQTIASQASETAEQVVQEIVEEATKVTEQLQLDLVEIAQKVVSEPTNDSNESTKDSELAPKSDSNSNPIESSNIDQIASSYSANEDNVDNNKMEQLTEKVNNLDLLNKDESQSTGVSETSPAGQSKVELVADKSEPEVEQTNNDISKVKESDEKPEVIESKPADENNNNNNTNEQKTAPAEPAEEIDIDLNDPDVEKAAVKIQAKFKGLKLKRKN